MWRTTLAFLVIFIIDGMLIGLSTAYEVLPVTWLVSMGWWMLLAYLFVCGAVGYLTMGYLVALRIKRVASRRRRKWRKTCAAEPGGTGGRTT